MRSRIPSTAGIVLLAGALHAAPPALELVQPLENNKGILLLSSPQQATIEQASGESQEISLRDGERLSEVAETRRGWVAAGVRERKSGRRELLVVMEDGAGVERLGPPGRQRKRLRIRPTLLIEDEELAGLAWLEGDDFRSLAVRYAEWTGADWGAVKRVSRPGRGSQTGLVGAVLADGSQLLVWSAYDGSDDEIVWSSRRGSSWSRPKRLTVNNRTPDIMPAVVATGSGALAVWSRYDGEDYRLMAAQLEGRKWRKPRFVGPAGSLEARFVSWEGEVFLTFKNAWPVGWSVADFGRQGNPTRRAFAQRESVGRPALAQPRAREATLLWPEKGGVVTVEWEHLP